MSSPYAHNILVRLLVRLGRRENQRTILKLKPCSIIRTGLNDYVGKINVRGNDRQRCDDRGFHDNDHNNLEIHGIQYEYESENDH